LKNEIAFFKNLASLQQNEKLSTKAAGNGKRAYEDGCGQFVSMTLI